MEPQIRRRQTKSRRNRGGLIRFACDRTSQNGEDGIIERLFQLLPTESERWCVDLGAWDGVHLSNTNSLLISTADEHVSAANSTLWHGVLVEADTDRFQHLQQLYVHRGNVCLNVSVSGMSDSPHTLENILKTHGDRISLPSDFDFLCIDIDGADYWVWHDLLKSESYRPRVVCVEFNPTIPDDLIYIPERSDVIRQGCSLAALVELANEYDYVLVETTLFNAFFVPISLYDSYLADEIPDTSIEVLHETTMGTALYQLYDGSIKLWGCKKLLWHRLPMDESKVQMLPRGQRQFPFAPRETKSSLAMSHAVDLRVCYSETSSADQRAICSANLVRQLQKDGFCYVRGTGIARQTCQGALEATHSLLQDADECVRRSCLTTDRARRGYSPMCTENFSSLLGETGPNDLVRKFRVGPVDGHEGGGALLQPNVWPVEGTWDAPTAAAFRAHVEAYYGSICAAATTMVTTICQGILAMYPDLEAALAPLMKESLAHSSILTLLGYRVGSRHKGRSKGPLVAAHTDVGVITVLVFDDGDCATLQRRTGQGDWEDVVLPASVPDDPIFVVNVADCFSELSGGRLPSTIHRVVARPGKTQPRNGCALFVGLDPHEMLCIQDEAMTYECWRKRRIARAQTVHRESSSS